MEVFLIKPVRSLKRKLISNVLKSLSGSDQYRNSQPEPAADPSTDDFRQPGFSFRLRFKNNVPALNVCYDIAETGIRKHGCQVSHTNRVFPADIDAAEQRNVFIHKLLSFVIFRS